MALALAPERTRVLDAGCATGSLPRALAGRGREAWGLDLEPAFLEVGRARARAEGLEVGWAEAGLLDLARVAPGREFRLITCLGQTLPHLLEEAEWLAFFGQARDRLAPGGHLVIQVLNDIGTLPGSSRDLPVLETPAGRLERRRTVLGPEVAAMAFRFTPPEGPALENRVLHRRMDPERAADLMRRAGLEAGVPTADEAGAPFGPASPGWVLAARRQG
jgi:SAM-dependent methyltransferase